MSADPLSTGLPQQGLPPKAAAENLPRRWSAHTRSVWAARGALALALAWNLQAALAFILAPQTHAPGFEVEGVPGRAIVQGLGILFLMWNVPYAAALVQPARHIVSFGCAVVAQLIGLAGETWLLLALPPGHEALRATGRRFVAFDGAGLVLLAVTFALVWRFRRPVSPAPPPPSPRSFGG